MSDLISREALLNELDDEFEWVAIRRVKEAPAVDAVSLGVFEQVKWERDMAVSQLEELGLGLGQKKPDMVEVVRCKDCIHWIDGVCGNFSHEDGITYFTPSHGYCYDAEREDDDE